MMCVFLNMGLYVLCVQVFTYMFTEMWKVVSWFMYRGRVYMRVSIVVCHEGTFTCLSALGMCVSVLGCIWLCVGVCVCVPVWACVAIGGDECARPVSWAGGVSQVRLPTGAGGLFLYDHAGKHHHYFLKPWDLG